MGHNASTIQMGTTGSSDKVVASNLTGSPATYLAGLAVRNNAGALSLTTGQLVGVSIGRGLSDILKTSYVKAGLRVPLQVTSTGAFVVVGDPVYVDVATGKAVDLIVDEEDEEFGNQELTGAVYASGAIDAVSEAGTTVKVALVDMPGGL